MASSSAPDYSNLNFVSLLLDPIHQEILEDIKEIEEEIGLEGGRNKAKGQQPTTPTVLNGHLLPIPVRGKIRDNLTGIPLREISSEYQKKDTFVVIGRGSRILYRFGDAAAYVKANGGWRNQAISILTHGVFNYFMVLAILLNLVIYGAIPFDPAKPAPAASTAIDSAPAPPAPPASEDGLNYGLAIKISNLAFVSLYILEFTLKVLARGLFKAKNPFSTLQISWSWLDVFVIVTGILSIVYPANRTLAALNAFRALKLIPLIPSWLGGYDLLFKKSWQRLLHATLFGLVIFFLLGIVSSGLYYTTLRNKCVLNTTATQIFESGANFTDDMFLTNPDGEYRACSNYSWSISCPPDHVCVKAGENPMGGSVGFDNLGLAELTLLNLVFQDFTEYVYQKIWVTHSSAHIIYAFFVFFVGTMSTGVLVYSVLGYEFLSGFSNLKCELDRKCCEKSNVWSRRFEVTPSNSWGKIREEGRKFVTDKNFDLFITFVILLDIITFSTDAYHIPDDAVHGIFLNWANAIIHFVYVVECILKVVFVGKPYWDCCWNRFDFVVAFIIGLRYIFGSGYFGTVIVITVLKIVPRWPKLNFLFDVMGTGIWTRWTFGIAAIFLFLFAYIGYISFGESYKTNAAAFPHSEIPRWNMVDFWHSYRLQLRAFCGEWIETLWDLLLVSPGFTSILFMATSGIIGNFLVTCLGLCIVLTAYNLLTTRTESDTKRTSLERIFWPVELLCRRVEAKITGEELVESDDEDDDEKHELNSPAKETENEGDGDKVANGKEDEATIVPPKPKKVDPEADPEPILPEKIMAHFGYKIFVCSLIVALSVLAAYEPLAAEITFVCYFGIEVIGRAALLGFGRRILSLGLLFDALQVINGVLALTLETKYGVWNFGTLRLLMIVCRITGLRLVRNQLWKQMRMLWQYFAATLFVWFVFALLGMTLFGGQFFKCIDGDGNVMYHNVVPTKKECIQNNMSWATGPENFNTVRDGMWTLYLTAAKNGWIHPIIEAEDRTGIDSSPKLDSRPLSMIYFIVFLIYGVLFPLASMVGILFHDFKRESWIQIFEQGWPCKSKPAEQRKASGGFLGKYVDTPYFELWVCFTILVDSILYAIEFGEISETTETVFTWLHHVILLLYIVELVLRAVTFKLDLFKHWLNYLLIVVILLSITEAIMIEVAAFAISAGIPRAFRLFHLLALDGIGSYKIPEFGSFRRALCKCFPVLSCITVFYGLLYASFSWFGATTFGALTETFASWNSTTTLLEVATISGMEGVYYRISNVENCVKEGETGEGPPCGYPVLAGFYVIGFLAITVFCFVNFYLALILETIEQLGKPEDKDQPTEEAEHNEEPKENDDKA